MPDLPVIFDRIAGEGPQCLRHPGLHLDNVEQVLLLDRQL